MNVSGRHANQMIDCMLGDEFKILGKSSLKEKKQKKWNHLFQRFTDHLNHLIARVDKGDFVDEVLLKKLINRIERIRKIEAVLTQPLYERIFGVPSRLTSMKVELQSKMMQKEISLLPPVFSITNNASGMSMSLIQDASGFGEVAKHLSRPSSILFMAICYPLIMLYMCKSHHHEIDPPEEQPSQLPEDQKKRELLKNAG